MTNSRLPILMVCNVIFRLSRFKARFLVRPPSGGECVAAVHLKSFFKRGLKVRHEFFASVALRIDAWDFFNPADPPFAVFLDNCSVGRHLRNCSGIKRGKRRRSMLTTGPLSCLRHQPGRHGPALEIGTWRAILGAIDPPPVRAPAALYVMVAYVFSPLILIPK